MSPSWDAPTWPKVVDPAVRLAALIEAVDAFVCGISNRTELTVALKAARG